jgi:hypothetical protein
MLTVPANVLTVDVNSLQPIFVERIQSDNDKGVRELTVRLIANGSVISMENNYTATAAIAVDNVLINDSIACVVNVSENTITIPIDNKLFDCVGGMMAVQPTVTDGTDRLTIPRPVYVRVEDTVAETAQITDRSLGSYAAVVKEIADARGTYTTLHDAISAKLDNAANAVKTMHITDSAVTLQKLAAEVKNIINGKADSATAYTFDATTTEAAWRANNYKIIYLNATLKNLNKKAIVITIKSGDNRQFGFCDDGSIYTRPANGTNHYEPMSWVNINADILNSITALQNNKVDTETFTEFQEAVAEEAGDILQDITGLENASIATNNAVADVKAYIGYTDGDILGVCADFENNRFTRLAGAVGLSAGADFDAFPMYGGRKRVVVTADGNIVANLSPTEIDGTTDYDVMVYQPKFYYKMVPLKLEKQTNGMGYHIRKANYYISATPHAGFKLHPLFYDANGNEIDYVLLGAYEASYLYWYATSPSTGYLKYFMDGADTDGAIATTDVLKSMPNVKPISSGRKALTVDGMEQVARQKSANWHLETIQAISASQLLMLVEYAQFELQSVIGRGIVQHNAATGYMASLTGATASIGDASGMASETIYNLNGTDTVQTTNGKLAITYRGVENPWGNIWKQIQGVNIWGDGSMNGGQPYICTDFQFSSSKHSGNYVGAGFTAASASGYVSAFGYGGEAFDWLFIASEAVGNSSLPVGDNCYVTANNNGYKRVNYGGRSDLAGTWAAAGAYLFAMNSATTNRAANMGGRLLYVPDAKGVS